VASPQLRVPLVGRDEELTALHATVAAVVAGRGGTVWLEGEPGIGKSALIGSVLAEARERQCQAYRAVGDVLGQQLPLRALTDALGSRLSGEAGLLDMGGWVEQETAVAAAVERFLVLVDRLCADRPVVFVLDDAQWADEASLLAWHRLDLAVGQIPLLLVGAARPVPVRASVEGLRRSVAERDGLLLPLEPLGEADTAALLEHLAGGTPGRRLRRAAGQAGGNPLYTRELVDALSREERIRVAGGVAELVGPDASPGALGAAIRNRLTFLPQTAIEVLRIAALLGAEFSAFDLATVAGRASGALLPVLDEAVAAGVLAESGGRLAFRHDLIRQALYEAVPATVRMALHRQAAQAQADAGLPMDQVGAHLRAAAPDALDTWAVDWLARNAMPLANRAPELTTELLPTATARVGPDDPRLVPLLRGLAQALSALNRSAEARFAARQAIAVNRDPAEVGRLAWDLANIVHAADCDGECLAVIDQALADARTSPVWRARLRALRARALVEIDDDEAAERVARQAITEGERLDDPIAVARGLAALYLAIDNNYTEGLVHLDRALAVIGHRPETADLRVRFLSNSSSALLVLGRIEEAEQRIREALILAEQLGYWRLPFVRAHAAGTHIDIGRWDDALVLLEPAEGQFALFERLVRLGGLAFIAAHRDERARCADLLAAAEDLPELVGYMRGNAGLLYMARAVAAEQRDGPAAGLAVLADTLAVDDDKNLFDRCVWLPDVARLALTAGRPDLARAALAAAEADAKAQPLLPRRVAAAERIRALLAGDAEALLEIAERYRTRTPPLAIGQCYEEAALLLAQAVDLTGARAALTRAAGEYGQLGAAWDIRRADARLRPLGVRRGPRSEHRRATTGWDALTPTEHRVATLVAEGRSNPDIAAELLLSRRTIQTHVTHILTKLGYRSRIEIAREVHRLTKTPPGSAPPFPGI
jgi:DNA-binding CsgD family transcriptional regulator/tetratricopeptide (TPR) repeat protein